MSSLSADLDEQVRGAPQRSEERHEQPGAPGHETARLVAVNARVRSSPCSGARARTVSATARQPGACRAGARHDLPRDEPAAGDERTIAEQRDGRMPAGAAQRYRPPPPTRRRREDLRAAHPCRSRQSRLPRAHGRSAAARRHGRRALNSCWRHAASGCGGVVGPDSLGEPRGVRAPPPATEHLAVSQQRRRHLPRRRAQLAAPSAVCGSGS